MNESETGLVERLTLERDEARENFKMLSLEFDVRNAELATAEAQRDGALILLSRVHQLGLTGGWRRMPDGGSFESTPLAGDIAAAIQTNSQN